jgi:peptide-methionine (R)-S-oxide reductase
MPYNNLTAEESRIIVGQGTEAPFTGEYDKLFQEGTYICRRCNNSLFSSEAKFNSETGWPSFDEDFPNSIEKVKDADGQRIEMSCANCGAHLGHIFTGEHKTNKNMRYCANSLSLCFVPKGKILPEVLHE